MATNACAALRILVTARTTFVQHRSVLNQSAVFNVCLQPRIFAHFFAVLVFLESTSEKDLLSAICWETAASTASQTYFRLSRSTRGLWWRRRTGFIRGASGAFGISCFGRRRGTTNSVWKVRIIRSEVFWCDAMREEPCSLFRVVS